MRKRKRPDWGQRVIVNVRMEKWKNKFALVEIKPVTEEEIFALAESLGLNRRRLKLYEPFNWQWGRRYRMEYVAENGQCHDYNFIVSYDGIREGLEECAVRCFVEDGLVELATKLKDED